MIFPSGDGGVFMVSHSAWTLSPKARIIRIQRTPHVELLSRRLREARLLFEVVCSSRLLCQHLIGVERTTRRSMIQGVQKQDVRSRNSPETTLSNPVVLVMHESARINDTTIWG